MLKFCSKKLVNLSKYCCLQKLISARMSTGRKAISTDKAPKAIGPYSQAMQVGNTLYISGQLGLDPTTMKFAGEDVQSQTRQALKNMGAILEAAGMNYSNVAKTTVLLANIDDFTAANEVYQTFFETPYPARAAYQVANLPKLGRIEIEAIAVADQ